MSISATEGLTAAAVNRPSYTAGSVPGQQPSAKEDKDLFMSLLVAQMRYQDPMNPADSSAFLTQTATFTQVEKLQEMADATAAMLSAQNSFGASGLVGRNVSWVATDGSTHTGSVDGVSFGVDGPVLDVAGNDVPLSHVLSVRASAAAAPENTPDSGTSAS